MHSFIAGPVTLRRKALSLIGAGLISLGAALPATASPSYAYQQTLAIPGTATTFSGYDLAAFDQSTQLYYLTDRSNNGIDVFSAKTNAYIERIGAGSFAGSQGGNNDIAGPNGISISNVGTGKLLIAGNGPSNFLSFNLDSSGLMVLGSPRTTSTAVSGTPTPANRVDGVAYAPTTNTILAANNASNPGFLTLVNNATGQVTASVQLNGSVVGGVKLPNVGANGVEGTIFNTARGTFFVAVPALDVDAKGNPVGAGGAIEIDPSSGKLLNTYDFNKLGLAGACSPTGIVQGVGASMLIACSDATAGQSVVLDPTGAGKLRLAKGISGGDQTAFYPGTDTFFEAARFQTGGPVLGIIDGNSLALQTLPIGENDHSVAVDPVSGEVFVASGPTARIPNCTRGCIGVFSAVPEPGTLPLFAIALAGLGVVGLRRRA